MQYILSEEEYEKLVSWKTEKSREETEKLQAVCTRIADEFPIKFWDMTEAKPWRCILTVKQEWYCDECPVSEICPHPNKEFSK